MALPLLAAVGFGGGAAFTLLLRRLSWLKTLQKKNDPYVDALFAGGYTGVRGTEQAEQGIAAYTEASIKTVMDGRGVSRDEALRILSEAGAHGEHYTPAEWVNTKAIDDLHPATGGDVIAGGTEIFNKGPVTGNQPANDPNAAAKADRIRQYQESQAAIDANNATPGSKKISNPWMPVFENGILVDASYQPGNRFTPPPAPGGGVSIEDSLAGKPLPTTPPIISNPTPPIISIPSRE